MNIYSILLVGIGGFIGSILRYLGTYQCYKHGILAPYSTLSINLIGSLLIGILFAWIEHNLKMKEEIRYLLIVGVCGGFTTFSTFSHENFVLLKEGQYLTVFIYITLSLIGGVGLAWLGYKVTSSL